MSRTGLAAFFLIAVLLMSCVSVSFAETAAPAEPIHQDIPDEAFTEDVEILPSVIPEEPTADTASSEPDPTAEPTADAEPTESAADPTQAPDHTPATDEPSPTDTPEPPAATDVPSADTDQPTLEIAAGQTIYLHQETPTIKIRWPHGMPSNVAGYVWSYTTDGGTAQVFYVTYDPNSTTLAAGALNGHISAPGSYVICCQPVDASQEPASDSAAVNLYVEQSSTELTISADRSFPVPAGASLTLTAHVGQQNSDVVRYEWKPAGTGSGDRICRINSVAAGPVRYTCTAVLRSGQRITGTLVVTGTELIATNRSVTLDSHTAPLTAVWSNGVPEGNIHYNWSVRGEAGTDLTQRGSISLPAPYLATLPARENPYTISCQAYKGKSAIADPATFQVRVPANSTVADVQLRSEKRIMGDENGVVPNTDDRSDCMLWVVWGLAAILVLFGGLRADIQHR